jgi:integrase
MQSEVLTLTLSQVDFIAGTLRINPGGSKTGEGRVVCFSAEVRMLVEEQLERVCDFRKS